MSASTRGHQCPGNSLTRDSCFLSANSACLYHLPARGILCCLVHSNVTPCMQTRIHPFQFDFTPHASGCKCSNPMVRGIYPVEVQQVLFEFSLRSDWYGCFSLPYKDLGFSTPTNTSCQNHMLSHKHHISRSDAKMNVGSRAHCGSTHRLTNIYIYIVKVA